MPNRSYRDSSVLKLATCEHMPLGCRSECEWKSDEPMNLKVVHKRVENCGMSYHDAPSNPAVNRMPNRRRDFFMTGLP